MGSVRRLLILQSSTLLEHWEGKGGLGSGGLRFRVGGLVLGLGS